MFLFSRTNSGRKNGPAGIPDWISRQTRRFVRPCLTGVPRSFAFNLEPGAVDQVAQRAFGSVIRIFDLQCLVAAAEGAEGRHLAAQTDQAQQALDEPNRLPEHHAEKHLHRQAGLDRGIAAGRLSAAFADRARHLRS